MRNRSSVLLICIHVVLVSTICGQNITESKPLFDQELPLRFTEPVDTIITDLRVFIPNYMNTENIPGVQIALIREGELAWTEGFGVTNTITGEPVTSNTLFEVASISKVVSAYMALSVVDECKISLEQPLHNYLSEEWLPPSFYRDTIKLSHVTSHSSGLGKISKDIMFKPGTEYYYSAKGFVLLQHVMEVVTGESFEQLAQRLVFKPLGMSNSSFIKKDRLIPHTASGHIHAFAVIILFGVLYSASCVIILLLGMSAIRLLTKSWKMTRSHIVAMLTLSFILFASATFTLLSIANLPEFALLLVVCGFVSLTLFLLIFHTGRKFILNKVQDNKGKQRLLSLAWSIVIIIGILLCSSRIVNLPVPRWLDYNASPAGTLRTSAQELAMFLIEISNSQYLETETAKHLRTSQITLSNNLAWGMGPGILYSEQGYALWQWGQHIDFQSIMIVYPEQKFGIVVCTNNDLLNPDVAVEIAHRALGGMIEPLRMAIHLQYDYEEQD